MLHEKRKLQVEEAKRVEFQKREKKKAEIRKDQESHTLDWIERRVTSSMMRITSKGITPTTLYWNKQKDGKTLTETEIDKEIIEGERWTIANQLSDNIGKKLDKVLYQKFKKNL